MPKTNVSLQLLPLVTPRQDCQILAMNLLKPTITVDELQHLKLPDDLQDTHGIILYGKVPNWLNGYLIEQFNNAPWIACCDVKLQAGVVISSHVPDLQPGDRIPIRVKNVPGPAILIGGPPKSGKSVFSHALGRGLTQAHLSKTNFLFRANWDGEGNHTFEATNQELVDRLRREHNRKLHQRGEGHLIEKYFCDRAQEVNNIRHMIDLTLVDVGGVPDLVKSPVVQQCTHYIVISRDDAEIPKWHSLCDPYLKPLAVIHSVLEDRFEILQTKPFLEVVAGPWLREQPCTMPNALLQAVLKILE